MPQQCNMLKQIRWMSRCKYEIINILIKKDELVIISSSIQKDTTWTFLSSYDGSFD